MDLRVEEKFVKAEFLELGYCRVEIVLAGDGLENAAAVEGFDDLDDLRPENDAIILKQRPIPQSIIQVPYDAFSGLCDRFRKDLSLHGEYPPTIRACPIQLMRLTVNLAGRRKRRY